jgi:hypothetical protein
MGEPPQSTSPVSTLSPGITTLAEEGDSGLSNFYPFAALEWEADSRKFQQSWYNYPGGLRGNNPDGNPERKGLTAAPPYYKLILIKSNL